MAKNQKKPTVLSMGGVLPRRPQPDKPPVPAARQVKEVKTPRFKKHSLRRRPSKTGIQILQSLSRKPAKKRKFSFFAGFSYVREKILYLAVPAFVAGLYFFDINKFPPILGSDFNIDSISDINSVLFLPLNAFLILLHKVHVDFNYEARLLGALLMLASIFCFYKMTSTWISRRMSLISTLLYACSSWSLLQARQSPEAAIMLAFLPLLLYLGKHFIGTDSTLARTFIAIVLVQFIFIPGGVWFLLFGLILSGLYFKSSPKIFILPAFATGLVLSAYGWLIYLQSLDTASSFMRLAGFASGSLPALDSIKTNITQLPGELFYGGPQIGSAWLAGTPIIDWITTVFLLAGFVYVYKSIAHPARKAIFSLFFVLTLLLLFINGTAYISVLLPLTYFVVAIGITHLTDRWLLIFPSNPLARGFGLGLVFAIAFLICAYHIERYFIGWPKTDEYHQVYKS